MAKSTNGLGQFSGKVGAVVFSIQNGQQVARQYQPIVSNPRTDSQMQQRAKLSFAGKLAALFPTALLMGMGTNNRMKRGNLVKQIIDNSSVRKGAAGFTAEVDAAKLRFIRGFAADGIVAAAPSMQGTDILVQWRDIDGYYGVTAQDHVNVYLVYIKRDGTVNPELEVLESAADVSTRQVSWSPRASLLNSDYVCHVYLTCTRQPTAGLTGANGDGVGGSDNEISSTLETSFGSQLVEVSNSYFLGSVDLVSA